MSKPDVITLAVTISRSSDDKVNITFEDRASGIAFATAHMSFEAFGYAVTGLSMQPADGEIRGLAYVGKKRVTEPRSIACPLASWSYTEELSDWLEQHAQEPGWLVNTYLGSRGSVVGLGDKGCTLNYTVTKYVDEASATSAKEGT